jgi:hypothetical protein
VSLNHLLLVENILLFSNYVVVQGHVLKGILDIFCDASSMMVNFGKVDVYYLNCEVVLHQEMTNIYPYPSFDISDGLKYLRY